MTANSEQTIKIISLDGAAATGKYFTAHAVAESRATCGYRLTIASVLPLKSKSIQREDSPALLAALDAFRVDTILGKLPFYLKSMKPLLKQMTCVPIP